MIRYICDKCGKEISDPNETAFLTLNTPNLITRLILCQKCEKELQKFIEHHTGTITLI